MNDTNAVLEARIAMYTLLSRIFMYEMDAQFVESLRGNEAFGEFFQQSKEWEEFFSLDVKKLCETVLGPEFVNLFFIWLVPYESFYTSDDQMVSSGSDNETALFYKQYGYEVDLVTARAVSGDFFAVECEFMLHLAKHELEALDRGDAEYVSHVQKVQREFLRLHLLPFALIFLPSVISAATIPLYSDAAKTALEFLLSDNETLSESAA